MAGSTALGLYRSEPIELQITPTGTQFNFQDYPQLRNAPVWGIELYTTGTVTNSPLSGLPILPTASMKTAFISLYEVTYDKSWGLYVNQKPVINFNRTNNTVDPFVFDYTRCVGQIVQWQKCFIRLTAAIGGSTTYAIYFEVQYGDPVASNQ